MPIHKAISKAIAKTIEDVQQSKSVTNRLLKLVDHIAESGEIPDRDALWGRIEDILEAVELREEDT